jgi:two-component system response regulator
MARRKMLLVEDNSDDVALARHACGIGGLAVDMVVARDGEEALDYLFSDGAHAAESARSLPDVIVLDLMLPRMGGLDVLRSIRSNPRTRRLPVVILTASSSDADMKTCYDLGANSYVRKPHGGDAFAGVISQLERYWLGVNIRPPV